VIDKAAAISVALDGAGKLHRSFAVIVTGFVEVDAAHQGAGIGEVFGFDRSARLQSGRGALQTGTGEQKGKQCKRYEFLHCGKQLEKKKGRTTSPSHRAASVPAEAGQVFF
jgi:hypothetical protein